MRVRILLSLLILVFLAPVSTSFSAKTDPFLVKPYVQLGNKSKQSNRESLVLVWETLRKPERWLIQIERQGKWANASIPDCREIKAGNLPDHWLCTARLAGLKPGEPFRYRLVDKSQVLFEANSVARDSRKDVLRFSVVGDLAFGSTGQKKIAHRLFQARPDFAVLTGDIVYQNGTISEYWQKFFPVYNADIASDNTGAPLLRSTLFIAVPGNHDIDWSANATGRNLDRFPDGLAYFLFWQQPLNCSVSKAGAPNTPFLIGSQSNKEAFLRAAGSKYPRMANFSFDYGNTHWLILDANPYMNWSNEELRGWVRTDLRSAHDATWRFVAFHQPPFSSDPHHFREQQMRILSDIFQAEGVDMVFSGHVHNYQRTHPLKFHVTRQPDGNASAPDGQMEGKFEIDTTFGIMSDRQRPHGVIYVITGGGGAPLTGQKLQYTPHNWQKFTAKFIANTHSFTVCEVDKHILKVRQISEDGQELDQFTVSK